MHMEPLFSELFHQSSKDHHKGHPRFKNTDPTGWPESWKTIYYKEYPRFEKIELTYSDRVDIKLTEAILNRSSQRTYNESKTITKEEIGQFLKLSCGLIDSKGEKHRVYPSGGGQFPLEVYPIVFRGDSEIPSGVYHYNPKEHFLDILWHRPFSDDDIDSLVIYPWVKQAAGIVIITAQFDRVLPKYGERGYRHILLEAGHIGQSMYLAARAAGIEGCALSGTKDKEVEELLDIDGINESVVYAFVFGK